MCRRWKRYLCTRLRAIRVSTMFRPGGCHEFHGAYIKIVLVAILKMFARDFLHYGVRLYSAFRDVTYLKYFCCLLNTVTIELEIPFSKISNNTQE